MFWSVTLSLLEGLREVVKLFALTLVFSLPLGLAVTFGSMSKCRPVSWFFNVLVWIVRGTPLMLQLILIFYGPGIWLGHNIWGSQRMLACTVAFVLNYACYFSVIYRGGIEGVPAGQREAGEVLGLTRRQIFFKITLLQMVKRIVPPMSNEIITLVKDTSLARIISIMELTKVGESYIKAQGITMAPVLHGGILSGLCGAADTAVPVHRAQAQLFSVRRGYYGDPGGGTAGEKLRRHQGPAGHQLFAGGGTGSVHHRLLRQRKDHAAAVPELFGDTRQRPHRRPGTESAGRRACPLRSGGGTGCTSGWCFRILICFPNIRRWRM